MECHDGARDRFGLRRTAWCAPGESRAIVEEGFVPADEDGLGEVSRFASPAKLVGYAGLAHLLGSGEGR